MQTEKNDKKAIGLALLAVLFWSTASTAFKLGLQVLSVVQLLWVASLTSTVVIAAVIVLRGEWRLLRVSGGRQLALSVLLAALNPVAYYLVLFKAYSLLPAQLAQPLNYTWPLVLVFLSAPVLKQRIEPRSYLALLVSFGGVVLISSQGDWNKFLQSDLTGVFLASGSALIWASFWLINQLDKRSELVKLFYSFAFGTVGISVLMAWNGEFAISGSQAWLSGVYVGLFEMGFSFVLWMKAMSFASSTDKIGNLVYLSPFMAMLFISGILGETILPTTVGGLLLIVAGIFIQKFGKLVRLPQKQTL